jgi:hypothetical protein
MNSSSQPTYMLVRFASLLEPYHRFLTHLIFGTGTGMFPQGEGSRECEPMSFTLDHRTSPFCISSGTPSDPTIAKDLGSCEKRILFKQI